jgi:hypothetical protein
MRTGVSLRMAAASAVVISATRFANVRWRGAARQHGRVGPAAMLGAQARNAQTEAGAIGGKGQGSLRRVLRSTSTSTKRGSLSSLSASAMESLIVPISNRDLNCQATRSGLHLLSNCTVIVSSYLIGVLGSAPAKKSLEVGRWRTPLNHSPIDLAKRPALATIISRLAACHGSCRALLSRAWFWSSLR